MKYAKLLFCLLFFFDIPLYSEKIYEFKFGNQSSSVKEPKSSSKSIDDNSSHSLTQTDNETSLSSIPDNTVLPKPAIATELASEKNSKSKINDHEIFKNLTTLYDKKQLAFNTHNPNTNNIILKEDLNNPSTLYTPDSFQQFLTITSHNNYTGNDQIYISGTRNPTIEEQVFDQRANFLFTLQTNSLLQRPEIRREVEYRMGKIQDSLTKAIFLSEACTINPNKINAEIVNSRYEFLNYQISDPFFNKLLLEAQYNISQLMCNKEGMIVGISANNAKKISEIVQKFNNDIQLYSKSHPGELARQIATHSQERIHIPPDELAWLHKVRNHPDNQKFYTINSLCKQNNFDEARKIVQEYLNIYRTEKQRFWGNSQKTFDAYSVAALTYTYHFIDKYDRFGIRKEFASHSTYEKITKDLITDENELATVRNDLNLFFEHSISIENHLNNYLSEKIIDNEILEARKAALELYCKEGDTKSLSIIKLSETAENYLQEIGIIQPQFFSIHANALQRQAQSEYKVLIEKAAALHNSILRHYSKDALQTNANLLKIGIEYTLENNIVQAQIIADSCYRLFNAIEQYIEAMPDSAKKIAIVASNIAKGATDYVIATAEYIKEHPLEMALTTAIPEIMAPYHLGKITFHTLGYTYERLSKIDYKTLSAEKVTTKFKTFYEEFKNTPSSVLVRKGTAIGLQVLLDGKITSGLNKCTKVLARNLAKKTKNLQSHEFAFASKVQQKIPVRDEGLGYFNENRSASQQKPSRSLPPKIPSNIAESFNAEPFNFTKKTIERMNNPNRMIPINTLRDIIEAPIAIAKDPQGSNALMYYSQLWKNGKLYNVEVLYDKAENRIMHFLYDQRALGPLPRIKNVSSK